MFRRFIAGNVAAADFIEDRLPRSFTRSLLYLHELTAARLMNTAREPVVLDVGGGHMSPFAEHRQAANPAFLIGADILPDQMRNNTEIDAGIVCDACVSLPLRDASVDLIVTRSVMEHLPDNAAFVAECRRVLKPGGRVAHVFPARRAPFALANRIIPNAVIRRLMPVFFPQWVDECGFRAFYNFCAYPEMPNLHKRHGFIIEELHLRYYQSIYFKPFLPAYLISLLYDLALWATNARFLCSQILIVARRDTT